MKRRKSGFTILETMIALLLIGISLVGAVSAIINNAAYVKATTHRIIAQGIAHGEIGKLRVLGYPQVLALMGETQATVVIDEGDPDRTDDSVVGNLVRTVQPRDLDGSGSIDVLYIQIDIEWTEFGRPYTQRSFSLLTKRSFLMRNGNRKGFTLPETLLAGPSRKWACRWHRQFHPRASCLIDGSDAPLLQRRGSDSEHANAPEIRLIQTRGDRGRASCRFPVSVPGHGSDRDAWVCVPEQSAALLRIDSLFVLGPRGDVGYMESVVRKLGRVKSPGRFLWRTCCFPSGTEGTIWFP
jgi:prepilin-type N-terminal cleavage/methylation domain-containing protein